MLIIRLFPHIFPFKNNIIVFLNWFYTVKFYMPYFLRIITSYFTCWGQQFYKYIVFVFR